MTQQTHASRERPSRRVQLDPDRLKRKRDEAGLQQNELAERAGVSPHAVSRAEMGRNISPKTLRNLAHALGCAIADLMPESAKRSA